MPPVSVDAEEATSVGYGSTALVFIALAAIMGASAAIGLGERLWHFIVSKKD